MKLLMSVTSTVVLAGLLGLTAFAQDAPQKPADASSTQPGAAEAKAAAEGPVGLPAEQNAEASQAGGYQSGASPSSSDRLKAERQKFIDSVRKENDLPPEGDTGWRGGNGDNSFWMPQQASAQSPQTDRLFWFIMWVSVFFTVGITAVMIYFAVRYRRKEGDPDPEPAATHSTTLEITWTVIPTCIVLLMFTLGFRGFLENQISPPNAYEVQVMGQMWNWSFTYPNGATTPDLHIPQGRPVKFVLQSADVLHDLYIPAFRMKKDAVPGRYNSYWIEATTPGVYDIFCAEYCGTNHSRMLAKCFVYPQDKYEDMLAKISNVYVDFSTGQPVPPAKVGEALWSQRGCRGCHSVDGSIVNAPTWKGLWDSMQPLTDGTQVKADENYIRESILYPQKKIVAGWGNAMPSYLGQLDDRDVNSIIAYMKTLNDNAKTTPDGTIVTPAESQSLPPDNESKKQSD